MALGRKHQGEELKGDMTPMIDVVFQLLIFFMLSIKFKVLEGKLSAFLPKDVGVNTSPAVPKDKVDAVVNNLAIKRLGTHADCANVCDFFVSPSSDNITGQVIYLGGVT